jgi:hypothetical protein
MKTPQPKPGERVSDVRFDDDTMSVDLADGREIEVRHPECLSCSRSGRTIAVATPEDAIKAIDLLLVVAIEHLNGRPRSSRRHR